MNLHGQTRKKIYLTTNTNLLAGKIHENDILEGISCTESKDKE